MARFVAAFVVAPAVRVPGWRRSRFFKAQSIDRGRSVRVQISDILQKYLLLQPTEMAVRDTTPKEKPCELSDRRIAC